MTAGGGQIFRNVPPGRYTAFSRTSDYAAASVSFDVIAGKTTRAVIKQAKGQKLTFRIEETEEDQMPGFGWVGYRVTKHGSNKPLFQDERGLCWGEVLQLSEQAPRSAGIRLEPGVYELMAVLRSDTRNYSSLSQTNLWSTTRTIKVVPGKDVVIEMGWKP
jgi:hypothetical protein